MTSGGDGLNPNVPAELPRMRAESDSYRDTLARRRVGFPPMVAFHDRWTVLPHGPLEQLADNLWRAEGIIPDFNLAKRVMVVVRRPGGDLLVHNPIALADDQMARLDAQGPIRSIVVPNAWHRLDARAFAQRYPEARVWCPSSARRRVAQAVEVAGDYEAFPADAAVALSYLPGVRPMEGVMTVRSADGVTLVFNDLLNNLPRQEGFGAFIYNLVAGMGRPRIHRMVGLMLIRRRAELRADLLRLAELPDLRRIVVAHGAAVLERPAEFLRAVA